MGPNRVLTSTTDVELLETSKDGRTRRLRPRRDIIPTEVASHDSVFDMVPNQDDPTLPPPPDLPFDPEEISLSTPKPPEIPGLILKTTQRMKHYLNSVRPTL